MVRSSIVDISLKSGFLKEMQHIWISGFKKKSKLVPFFRTQDVISDHTLVLREATHVTLKLDRATFSFQGLYGEFWSFFNKTSKK